MSLLTCYSGSGVRSWRHDDRLILCDEPRYMQALTQSLTPLLDFGADPNLAHASTGETSLMIFAANVELVRLVLGYRADVSLSSSVSGKQVSPQKVRRNPIWTLFGLGPGEKTLTQTFTNN